MGDDPAQSRPVLKNVCVAHDSIMELDQVEQNGETRKDFESHHLTSDRAGIEMVLCNG